MVSTTSRLPVSREFTISQSEISAGPSTPGAQNDRLVINVGGVRHETYLSTLKSIPDTRLFWMVDNKEQSPDYDSEKKEFFFDRHPGLFAYILNFYQTGRLHCPADICGPLFEDELSYWGIDEAVIEPCCWMNYRKHREAQVNLHSFDSVDGDKESLSNTTVDEENPILDPQLSIDRQDEPRHVLRKIRTLWKHWQPRMWTLLEEPNSSFPAQVLGFISMFLIVASVTTFCMETLPFFSDKGTIQSQALYYIEAVCVAWFTVEFILRLIFSTDKMKFFKGIMNWFDVCAILPFFLEMTITTNVKTIIVLRVVRLIRVFRIFKLSRHSYGLQILGHTLKSSCRELFLLVFFLSIGVIIFSSLIYYAEKDVYKSKFNSIPEAFWWSVVTMTTIGYGDIVPITWPGKCVGILCALCGVLVIALPIPVIVSNFSLYYSHAQAKLRVTGKTKPKSVFSKASKALRVANSWAFAAQQVQRRHSEASEVGYFCPSNRLTPLQSPSANQRQTSRLPPWEAGTMSNNPSRPASRGPSRGPSRSHSPKASPFASRASSVKSIRRKSHCQTTIQSGTTTPRKNSLTKNYCIPTLQFQLKVNDNRQHLISLNNFSSNPSINVSPPSTPSKTNSVMESTVPSPYPQSVSGSSLAIDETCPIKGLSPAVTPDRRQSVPNRLQLPYDFCSSPSTPTSPLYSGLPSSSPSGLSTPRPWSDTTSVSSSSRIQSPRGRMGRRNGIFIIGLASKTWQKKSSRSGKGRKSKRTGSSDNKSEIQSSKCSLEEESSPVSSRDNCVDTRGGLNSEDEVLFDKNASSGNDSESQKVQENSELKLPTNYNDTILSPGVSKTLNEVSKRLRNFITHEKDGDTPKSASFTDISESSDSRPSSSDLIRNMLSPLVRQKAIFKFNVPKSERTHVKEQSKQERGYDSSSESSDGEKKHNGPLRCYSSEVYGECSGSTSDEACNVFQLSSVQSTTLYQRRRTERTKDKFKRSYRKSSRSSTYSVPPTLIVSSPGQEEGSLHNVDDYSIPFDDLSAQLSPCSDRALSPIQEQSSQSSDNRGARSVNSSNTGSTLASFDETTILHSDGSNMSLTGSNELDVLSVDNLRIFNERLARTRLSWPCSGVNSNHVPENRVSNPISNCKNLDGYGLFTSKCDDALESGKYWDNYCTSVQRSKSLPKVQRSFKHYPVPQVRIESYQSTEDSDESMECTKSCRVKPRLAYSSSSFYDSLSGSEDVEQAGSHLYKTSSQNTVMSSLALAKKRKEFQNNQRTTKGAVRHNSWSRFEIQKFSGTQKCSSNPSSKLERSRSHSLPNDKCCNDAANVCVEAAKEEELTRFKWMKRSWGDLHDSGVQSMSMSQTVDHSSSPDLLSPKTPSEKETKTKKLSGNFEYFRNLFKDSIHEEQFSSNEENPSQIEVGLDKGNGEPVTQHTTDDSYTNCGNEEVRLNLNKQNDSRKHDLFRSKSLSFNKDDEMKSLSARYLSDIPLDMAGEYVHLSSFTCLTKNSSLDESYTIPSA